MIHKLSLDVDGTTSGASTGRTGKRVNGYLHSVRYVPAAASSDRYLSTADVTILTDLSSQQLLSQAVGASAFFRQPRLVSHTTAGAGMAPTTGGGSHPERWPIADERLRVQISQTSSPRTGTWEIWIEGQAPV